MSDSAPPPAQVTYGESMAEALKAQAEFLKGTGDFAEVGSLESLLPLERSIREKTAQTDTDILRQTLLGGETQTRVVRDPETGRFGIPDGEIVTKSTGTSAGHEPTVPPDGSSDGHQRGEADRPSESVHPVPQFHARILADISRCPHRKQG